MVSQNLWLGNVQFVDISKQSSLVGKIPADELEELQEELGIEGLTQ